MVVDAVDKCGDNTLVVRHSGKELVGDLSIVVEFGEGFFVCDGIDDYLFNSGLSLSLYEE